MLTPTMKSTFRFSFENYRDLDKEDFIKRDLVFRPSTHNQQRSEANLKINVKNGLCFASVTPSVTPSLLLC